MVIYSPAFQAHQSLYLNWDAVPNYPLVVMEILRNWRWASYPDSLSGPGQTFGWDEEGPLIPSCCRNQRPCLPSVCPTVKRQGVPAVFLAHGPCHKYEKVPGKNLGAIKSTCYWVKWLLVSHRKDHSAAWRKCQAQTRKSSTFGPFPADTVDVSMMGGESLLHSGGRNSPQLDNRIDPDFTPKIGSWNLKSIFNRSNIINKSLKLLPWLS